MTAAQIGTLCNNVIGTSGADTISGTADGNNIFGQDGNDTITYASHSNNKINGGTGNDLIQIADNRFGASDARYGIYANTFTGGKGNDRILSDGSADTYTFNRGDGADSISDYGYNYYGYTPGNDKIQFGAGITRSHLLITSSSNNLVISVTDPDNPSANDQITVENWYTSATYQIETLQFSDGSSLGKDELTSLGRVIAGSSGNDTLTGDANSNTIDGGAGNDTMSGGAGNDIYVVNSIADLVTENADAGIDTIRSNVTQTLSGNVENLVLTGAAAINGTGNTLNNVLTGNSANNTLSGGAGNDIMIGGAGNDTYVVDSVGDVVTEIVNGGTDLVQSSVTYTLGANLEKLVLSGTTAINGMGNALNNVLTGNSADNALSGGAGNDILDGGAGNDTMIGGQGDDVFVVNVSTDVVIETASAGNDTVQSSVTLTLAGNVENLMLTGTSAINGTGNTLNNLVRGNTAANALNGGTGNDILEGGAGNDLLTDTSGSALFNGGSGADSLTGGASAEIFLGGQGNDTYTTAGGNDIILFNKGDGQDTFSTGGTGSDTLSLGGNGLSYADLAFAKSSNDLILKVGSSDQITFKNWYATTPSKPVANLQVMAEAMAGFVQGGSDPLRNQKVENFNFAGLVGAFDAARAANTGLTSWALTNALTSFQLAGSDTAALGGDLAYQYGRNGTLAGIGATPALATLSNASLGGSAQTLTPLAGLQTGSVRLS